MRVFLDTNVLASAFATRGLCEDVLREVLAAHELILADRVLKELERVFTAKFEVPKPAAAQIIEFLSQGTVVADPGDLPHIAVTDESDRIMLACAVRADANVFVTGDKELIALKSVGRMSIVSPREFWRQLKK
jgi:putative PIN family toxin of toxin-antitoxin system